MKFVRVEWIDSHEVLGNWTLLTELDEDDLRTSPISTVGFVLRDTDDRMVIVLNNGGDQVSNGIVIPRCSIESVVELTEKEPLREAA